MEIIRMDFNKYKKEFCRVVKGFSVIDVLTHYELPNLDDMHMMVCGYSGYDFEDRRLFDTAESIDYIKYEKELWKQKGLE